MGQKEMQWWRRVRMIAQFPALGAHYLPFVFLYGMWHFGALAGILVLAGIGIGVYLPAPITLGAWITCGVLMVFAFIGLRVAAKDRVAR